MDKEVRISIRNLLREQKLAVLATDSKGLPYTSLVAFTEDLNLKYLLIATFRETSKFENMVRNNRVTLLVDNRKNIEEDFEKAVTVMIEGTAVVIEKEQSDFQRYLDFYLKKHPHLEKFIKSPNCALIRIDVRKYHFVSNFQNKKIISMNEE